MIPRYSIKEELDWGTGHPVYRALRDQDNLPVIIKTHLPGKPDSAVIQKFTREYELMRDRDIEGITKVYDLVTNENQVALVLEDSDGMPLHHWLNGKVVELESFLNIAILLSEVLTALHQDELIHGDIRPANILINFPAGTLKLTGLGLAARHSQGENTPGTQDFSTRHLSYVSPEQTGRMNRSPDYRSDFYSLGVTFYEMLTGKLPFDSNDSLELLHCHIAIESASPSEVNPAIPETISAIILKLLAKAPEDRYQSGMGLTKDLQKCLRQWRQTGKIEVFVPGKLDFTDRFEIPQKLYGREAEVAELLSIFEQAGKGASEMLLVTGYSGIGKSALVNEVRRPIIQRRGYFISGKFDQFKHNLPYNAIIQAFKELIRQILTENEQRIAEWKEKLLRVLGANGQVMIAVIPEVELIIGPQPPVAELPPVESQNRFNLVFQNFMEVFAREEHPLIIFLDDLQWADAATLRLLQTLVTDPNFHHLLIIGAYRDNEVEATHPLIQALKKIQENGIEVTHIILGPLKLPELNKFISHILKCHPRRSKPLSELILSKTGGNPFFVTQFMKSLYQENLLEFDHRRGQWKFNLERILRKDLTDNVIDFMAGKIRRLSPRAQQVARLAACLGNRFELNILAIVNEKSAAETLIDLEEVLLEELIVPISDVSTGVYPEFTEGLNTGFGFHLFAGPGEAGISDIKADDRSKNPQSAVFRFLHDRVQQTAYALILAEEEPAFHLKVGRLILEHIDETRREEYLFEIVNHFNIGAGLMKNSQERENLGRLNLQAGRKAKSATAYQTALNYFRSGIAFLHYDCWISQYELAFELYREQAECEYLCGNFEEAGRVFDLLLEQVQTKLDKAKVYNLRILQYEYMSRYAEAIHTGHNALALFGFSFPDSPGEKRAALEEKLSAIEALTGERGIESFISLPALEDPEMCMVMQLLSNLHTPCFLAGDKPLTMLNTATMVHLSLFHGNTKESAYAYALHAAMTLAPLEQEYAAAYDFGMLALKVNDRFYDPGIRARVLMTFAWAISIWRKPIQDSFAPTREAFRLGNETGFFVDAAYALFNESWFALLSGADLEAFRNIYDSNAKYIRRVEMHQFADAQQVILQWGYALEGRTEHPTSFSDANFDENAFCETYRDYPLFRMFYLVAKLAVLYTFDEYRAACKVAEQAEEVIKDFPGTIWDELRVFYHALALAALYPSVSKKEQHEIKATLEAVKARLQRWAENAPYLYRLQHLIVSAEIVRLHGQDNEAITLYETAIEAASDFECPRESGLANEVYARFWLRRKQRKVAAAFMNEARSAYARWNAKAKVEALERTYPELLVAQPIPSISLQTNSSVASSTAQLAPESKTAPLDLFTVLKAAQAISGEIVVEKLLKKLMRIAIENAGAREGYLIIQRGSELIIEMHGSVEKNEIKVEQTIPPESNQLLSSAVINYVKRTLEHLVIAEAEFDSRFAHDEYIVRKRPKSILCTPILNQGQLTGILYLENNLTAAAFTPDRIEVMQILASQATISLENARLYEEMKKEIAERKHAEEALRMIAEGTASVTGGDFFCSLVQHLAEALKVRYAFVTECVDAAQTRVRTLAYLENGQIGENIEYDLSGTPCESVIREGQVCYFAEGLEQIFPIEAGKESYLGVPLRNSAGTVIGHLAVLDDKSFNAAPHDMAILNIFAARAGAELEGKHAEEALRESEERFRSGFENAQIGMAMTAQDGRLLLVNRAFCRMLGYSPEELLNIPFQKITHPDDLEKSIHHVQEVAQGERESFGIEKRYLHKNGQNIWAITTASVVRNARGKPWYLFAQVQDITARKQAEEALQRAHEELEQRVKERTRELSRANTLLTQQIKERLETEKALRESETAYRDLYEEAPNVYVSTGTDGLIKRANQRAVEFFGLELEEIIGKPIFNLVADGPTGKERAQKLFQRFISGKETLGEEIQFRKADGSLVWGSVSVRPFMDQSGNILASRSIIVDINERKNVELKLQEAKEAAEAANRAKSEFLANMSHELRTPLNGILGYAQVLKRDKNLSKNQMKGLEIIEKSGEHLLTLINDILDLSKIETGKLEFFPGEFPLPEFLKNIAEITRVGARQKGLTFNYRPLSPLPAVVIGDEKRLRQVLLNLLGNAVKFTDPALPSAPSPRKGKSRGHSTKGSITFTVGYIESFSPLRRGPGTFTAVSGDQKNHGNSRFCFQVEDTGRGIEAKRLEEIFLPFHQIPQEHKLVEGTGLGLAISQKLVKLMGGELQMTSKPGKGSIFRVVLELPAPFKERDTAVLTEKIKKSSGEIRGYAGDPRKILIVDDKWENRSVVINLLSPLGFLLEEAENGKEAIKKTQDFQPHLILMDLVMPEMDGFEAVRNIRKSAELKDVVIIALSASVFEHNRRQSTRAGCDDFIPKPLSAELLFSKLQYYLNLEWIEEQKREEISADIPPSHVRDPLIGPSSTVAKELYELAMMGDIHGLEREISLLEKENRELIPFVARIHELLKNYKMKQVREFVKQFVE